MMTGTKLTHVPYKGSAAALVDVLSGQLPMMFDTLITSLPQLSRQTARDWRNSESAGGATAGRADAR